MSKQLTFQSSFLGFMDGSLTVVSYSVMQGFYDAVDYAITSGADIGDDI